MALSAAIGIGAFYCPCADGSVFAQRGRQIAPVFFVLALVMLIWQVVDLRHMTGRIVMACVLGCAALYGAVLGIAFDGDQIAAAALQSDIQLWSQDGFEWKSMGDVHLLMDAQCYVFLSAVCEENSLSPSDADA